MIVQLLVENLVGHFEQRFLCLAQEAGIVHLQVSDKISGTPAATARKACAGDPDFCRGRRFGQQGFSDTAQGRHVDNAAGKHTEDADRQVRVDVATFQAKERMGTGVKNQIQVTGLPVLGCRPALAGHAEFLTGHHGRWDADRELPVGRIPAPALTVGALIFGEVALSAA